MDALKSGDLTGALKILNNVDSVNYRDNCGISLLMYAVKNNFIEVCRILIDKGADMNYQYMGKTSLFNLDEYSIKGIKGITALYLASELEHFEIVKLLVEKGALLDLQTKDGATSLMVAAFLGQKEIVKLLLEKGANQNIKNTESKKASDYAADPEIKVLFSKKINKLLYIIIALLIITIIALVTGNRIKSRKISESH